MLRSFCVALGVAFLLSVSAGYSLAFPESSESTVSSTAEPLGAIARARHPASQVSTDRIDKEAALSIAIVAVPDRSARGNALRSFREDFVFDLPVLVPLRDLPPESTTGGEEKRPPMPGDWVRHVFSVFRIYETFSHSSTRSHEAKPEKSVLASRRPSEAPLAVGESLHSAGKLPGAPQVGYSHVSIRVSHSKHELFLIAHPFFGKEEVLFYCRVGLGASDFPTPVGTYFVTHIYDDYPWWIPPRDRAWAFGQSPSRDVYGGTMAPLLKKREIRSKHRSKKTSDDFIAGKVQLEDYGYRFHGTNQPRSIGRNESHGCVRMKPADAKKLANLVMEHVGARKREASENGTYLVLKVPVRLNLVK